MTSSPNEFAELRDQLTRIARRKIFFGHQSVGADVVRGLAALADELRVSINIAETSRIEGGAEPCFAHARVGQNEDPASKLDEFSALLNGGLGDVIDLAMVKLCYVDVTRDTDTVELARHHDDTFDALARRHRGLRLLPVTVPLTTGFFGLRGAAAKLLGHNDPANPDNRARARYNDHLRRLYADRRELFDLAAVESGVPAPPPGGRPVPALSSRLTCDGGHLNRRGRKLAAVALVRTLGQLL